MHTTRAPEEVSAISGTGTTDSSSLQEHGGFRSEEFQASDKCNYYVTHILQYAASCPNSREKLEMR